MAVTTYLNAINQALREEMQRDEKVYLLGEDIVIYGGAFKVTKGLIEEFGKERVIDTPISESAIIGVAVGTDRKSTRLNSSHIPLSRMPSSA